jgi:hypothetical protein
VVEELKQIEIRKVFKPKKASDLTNAQKRASLEYLMYLFTVTHGILGGTAGGGKL